MVPHSAKSVTIIFLQGAAYFPNCIFSLSGVGGGGEGHLCLYEGGQSLFLLSGGSYILVFLPRVSGSSLLAAPTLSFWLFLFLDVSTYLFFYINFSVSLSNCSCSYLRNLEISLKMKENEGKEGEGKLPRIQWGTPLLCWGELVLGPLLCPGSERGECSQPSALSPEVVVKVWPLLSTSERRSSSIYLYFLFINSRKI